MRIPILSSIWDGLKSVGNVIASGFEKFWQVVFGEKNKAKNKKEKAEETQELVVDGVVNEERNNDLIYRGAGKQNSSAAIHKNLKSKANYHPLQNEDNVENEFERKGDEFRDKWKVSGEIDDYPVWNDFLKIFSADLERENHAVIPWLEAKLDLVKNEGRMRDSILLQNIPVSERVQSDKDEERYIWKERNILELFLDTVKQNEALHDLDVLQKVEKHLFKPILDLVLKFENKWKRSANKDAEKIIEGKKDEEGNIVEKGEYLARREQVFKELGIDFGPAKAASTTEISSESSDEKDAEGEGSKFNLSSSH